MLATRMRMSSGYSWLPFLATNISGCLAWFDAYQITGLVDGNTVATWVNIANGAANATQTTETNKPTYKTSIINDRPVVRFDGNDNYLSTPVIITSAMWQGSAAYSIVLVMQPDSFAAEVVLGLRQTTDTKTIGRITTATRDTFATIGVIVRDNTTQALDSLAAKTATTDWQSFILNRQAGTGTDKLVVWRNNVLMTTWYAFGPASITGTLNHAGGMIGASQDQTAIALYFDGDIAEIIIYNKLLSEAERLTVNTYISAKYGL